MSAWIEPRFTRRFTPLTAVKPLNSRVSPRVSSIVSPRIMFPSMRSKAKHYRVLFRAETARLLLAMTPPCQSWRGAPMRTVIHAAPRSMDAIVAPMMQRNHWDLHLVFNATFTTQNVKRCVSCNGHRRRGVGFDGLTVSSRTAVGANHVARTFRDHQCRRVRVA